ncbi:hemolysin family protein [Nafulsella turpanensis]|uniref:hemolysin family protein n=1 Tax=Nafulsella turpanensis TaxID=1265690 RepID=UPI0003454D00|nr:hemolysin family protein [Nafulsella turpanensis]
MALLIFYLLLALVVSFLCSILEASLLSFTPSYIESIRKEKPGLSKNLRQLKDNIDRPLAAILSLNTIAHTVGAAGVGAQAAIVFNDVGTGIISGVLTLLILVFSEIIPKTLGARYWRQLSFFTAKTLRILIWALYPLVLLSNLITKMMGGNPHGMAVSREEVSAMADMGHKEGVFAESETKVIKNLIAFREVKAKDIMTPRTVVVAARQDMSLEELSRHKDFMRFSRIPIYKEERDNVIGYIHKHELLEKMAMDQHQMKVSEIARDMLIVPHTTTLPQLFQKLMETREQIALAVDEYGGMAGVVTIEDVLETLLGVEIVDEFDSRHDMQEYARQKWRQRAKELGILPDKEPPIDPGKDQFINKEGIHTKK